MRAVAIRSIRLFSAPAQRTHRHARAARPGVPPARDAPPPTRTRGLLVGGPEGTGTGAEVRTQHPLERRTRCAVGLGAGPAGRHTHASPAGRLALPSLRRAARAGLLEAHGLGVRGRRGVPLPRVRRPLARTNQLAIAPVTSGSFEPSRVPHQRPAVFQTSASPLTTSRAWLTKPFALQRA